MAEIFAFTVVCLWEGIFRLKSVSNVGVRTDVLLLKHVEIKIFTKNDISVDQLKCPTLWRFISVQTDHAI